MRIRNIITVLIFITLLIMAAVTGCKNDGITGPNQNSSVSFQVSQRQGQNGGTEFLFRPSADTKLSRLVSRYPAQQFADTISYGSTNYVYSRDTTYIINEYINVAQGQQWIFDFTGSASPGGMGYTVSSDYTVQ